MMRSDKRPRVRKCRARALHAESRGRCGTRANGVPDAPPLSAGATARPSSKAAERPAVGADRVHHRAARPPISRLQTVEVPRRRHGRRPSVQARRCRRPCRPPPHTPDHPWLAAARRRRPPRPCRQTRLLGTRTARRGR